MKQASRDTRERALAAYKNGTSIAEICRIFGICRKTFYSWRKREQAGGEQLPLPKGHPPRYLQEEDLRNIQNLFSGNNHLSAREICEKLGLTCHPTVIYRALKQLGLNRDSRARKSSKKNKD